MGKSHKENRLNDLERKGQSPFYPGQPVPVELFVGRKREVDRIRRAGLQVASGKPQAIYISGEYGIGKSSLARYARVLLQDHPRLFGFHVLLGGAETLEDVALRTVQSITESLAFRGGSLKALREFLGKYVGEQSLFGIKLRLDKLRDDAPDISRGYLPFLCQVYLRIKKEYKGLTLVLDEINGLTGKDSFARFLKNLIDENALRDDPLPMLLLVCGTPERLRELVSKHPPIERVFEIAQIDTMSVEEMVEFFTRAFESVSMRVTKDAMEILTRYSGGLPKLMHLLGDAAFWVAPDNVVSKEVAMRAVWVAAEDVGRKFVEQQVYRAIRSADYRRILEKLATHDFDLSFRKKDIEEGLSDSERRKFNNFLQRMKRLNVLQSGEHRGEYVFRDRLTRLYMRMVAMREPRSEAI